MAENRHAHGRVRGARQEVTDVVRARADTYRAIRSFFDGRGFLEIDPPVRIQAPAPEPYIDALAVSAGGYLRPSPELHMKRLVALGYPLVYSLGPCFRANERTPRHREEFCLLEWYRGGATYVELMTDVEGLLPFVARRVLGRTRLATQGRKVDLARSERITVRGALARLANADADALDDDRWSETLGLTVEPALGERGLTLLYDYPLSQGALARRKPDNPRTVERVEAYVAGLELANGWTELADSEEQRARFEADRTRRRSAGKDPYPLDEEYLAVLPALGLSAGIALGVDRLLMLLLDAPSLDALDPWLSPGMIPG